MDFRRLPMAALIAILAILSASPLLAKTVGTVLEVTQGAHIVTAGGTAKLTLGMQVTTGDIIKTNGSGQVQLLFGDDTKIAVGPKSQLVLEDILLRSNGSAKRFTINALGGTFRFISGKSPKKVYGINTPTATMGIRGTIFDFFVEQGGITSVVLFEGEVQLCQRNGSCERATGSCTLSRVRNTDLRIGISTGEFKNRTLRDDFPYVVAQNRLLSMFHAPIRSCGNIKKPKKKKVVPPPPPPPPEPAPKPEWENDPAPKPEWENDPAPKPEWENDPAPKPEWENELESKPAIE